MAVKGTSGTRSSTAKVSSSSAASRPAAKQTGDPDIGHMQQMLQKKVASLAEAIKDIEADLDAVNTTPVRMMSTALISDEALAAFAETVSGVLADSGENLSVQAARRAGLLAVASTAWTNALGPLFDSGQVREILGSVSRQRVDELLRERRLIAMKTQANRWVFPAFQFHDGHQPPAALASAFWQLAETAMDPWSAAAWCVSPSSHLDGHTPAQVAGEQPDLVARAGARDADRLSR